jgi:hypothetical protein
MKCAFKNSVPLSKSSLVMAKGSAAWISLRRSRVACAPRFHTARTSVQPLWMSVASSAQTMAPERLPPHSATVSISRAPGAVSTQGSQRTATSRCMVARALLAMRRLRPAMR